MGVLSAAAAQDTETSSSYGITSESFRISPLRDDTKEQTCCVIFRQARTMTKDNGG